MTLEQRFWAKVEPMMDDRGCWEWAGALDGPGYGRLKERSYKCVRASRLSWMIHFGPIPGDLFVCHRCDNRACVNPMHLYLGSRADNASDMTSRFRQARGSRQGCSRLQEQDVLAIRESSAAGVRQAELARHFGVSKGTIAFVVKRVTWRHV
jgi:hypothetical protein